MSHDVLLPAPYLINNEEDFENEIKQFLFNLNLFKTHFELNQFVEFYNKSNENKLLHITDPHTYLCVTFYLGLLSHRYNTYAKDVFDKIMEVYKEIDKTNEKIMLGWDCERQEVIVFE